jgi:serine/threonine protein phosphatase 1
MDKERVFVIGDIHGCFKTLEQLLFNKIKVSREDTLYFLGDYIDRGPSSKEVIDLLIDLINKGYKINCVIGNHEKLLLDSIDNDEKFNIWLYNGAAATLRSFLIAKAADLSEDYISFFKNLQYYYIHDGFIIVHGGLNFEIENPLEDTSSMIWIRNDYIIPSAIGNKKIIVGHTPVPIEKISQTLLTDKIMLDGGCVYKGKYVGLGNLVALELNSMQLFVKPNIDF